MSDIQAGDLVVAIGSEAACQQCIAEEIGRAGNGECPRGSIHRVAAVHPGESCPALDLGPHYEFEYSVCCFRKIRPDEQEPCEEEFVTLIRKMKPVKERTDA